MAGFVQIIEYKTSRPDEIRRLGDEFRSQRQTANDGPSPTNVVIAADRDNPGVYRTIVKFNSYEEAMENSNRPETGHFAEQMAKLCDGPPTFYNLDVLSDESM